MANNDCAQDGDLQSSPSKEDAIVGKNEETSLTLAERQRIQREAQLKFLQNHGLLRDWTVRDSDEEAEESSGDSFESESVSSEDLDFDLPSFSGEKETDADQLDSTEEKKTNGSSSMAAQVAAAARKTGVAVAGGAMVTAGAILAPLPTPGGILLAGAGLGVLGTEFESAKNVLDTGRDQLVKLIDDIAQDEKEKEKNSSTDGDADENDEEKKPSEDAASTASGDTDAADSTASKPFAFSSLKESLSGKEIFSRLKTQAHRVGQTIRPHLVNEKMDDPEIREIVPAALEETE